MAQAAAAAARGTGAVRERIALRRPHALLLRAGGVALLAVLYDGAAMLGYALQFSGPVAAIVWLPVGVGAAFLARFGVGFWPGALIGDLLANDYSVVPLAGAFGQTVGNLAEVVLAGWLVRRLTPNASPLDRTAGVARLLLVFAVATGVSALVGPLSLLASGGISADSLLSVMRTWWLGDFCGVLVVVPLVLAWSRPPRRLPATRHVVEGAAVLAAIGVLSAIAADRGEPLTYLIFPLLFWTAVRFGVRGGTLAVTVTVATTVVANWHAEGPFVSIALTHSVLSTQAFIVVAMASTLLLAAATAERHVLVDRLGASQARATSAANAERRRIERDLHDGAQQRLLALALRLRIAAHAPSAETLLAAERELQVAIDELRELSHGMHPAVLTQLGLAGAVRTLCERSAVPVALVELPSCRLDERAEAAAYFVLTEVVANVQKHADARSITIAVAYRIPWLRLTVTDDGRGGAVERAGSGVAGMRARIEELDGEFSMRSTSAGTSVTATIPAFPA